MNHNDYQNDMFTSVFQKRVSEASYCIMALRPKPALIAVRGMSGALVGGAVSWMTGIPVAIVRKPEDTTHADGTVQGPKLGGGQTYVVLDDFVATGSTVSAIMNAMHTDGKHRCIAVVLYAQKANPNYKRDVFGVPVYGTIQED